MKKIIVLSYITIRVVIGYQMVKIYHSCGHVEENTFHWIDVMVGNMWSLARKYTFSKYV